MAEKEKDARTNGGKPPMSPLRRVALCALIAGVFLTIAGVGGGFLAQRIGDPLRYERTMGFLSALVRYGAMTGTAGAAALLFLRLWRVRPGKRE